MTTPSTEPPSRPHDRYDAVTIGFHWVTALLVVVLFGMTLIWNSRTLKHQLESLHVSLGIVLAAVLIARLLWRLFGARRLPGTGMVVTDVLSRIVHAALYLLLAIQVGLGFGLRWYQGEAFSLFGWFSIPNPFTPDRAFSHQLEGLHNLAGWTLIYVAGAHALAALFHRLVLKDGVLRRMLPFAG